MGILGSALGRAVAGGATAAVQLSNKYIDEELSIQRAQALADIQRANGQRMREDEDAFQNDPTRVARDRQRKRDDALAAGKTARDVELEGLTDPNYQGAKRTKAQEDAAAARREKVADIEATTPAEVNRTAQTAEAQAKAQAKYREPRAGSASDVADKVRAIEKALGRPLSEAEKLTALGLVKGRDPELDTETVTVEELQPDGTVKKVQRKQVRRPGQEADAPAEDPLKAAMDKARAEKAAKDGAKKPTAAAPGGTAAAPAAAAPAAPAVPTDPLAGKSRSEIREIEAELRAELQRWKGKPNSQGRTQEIETLLQRIANRDY